MSVRCWFGRHEWLKAIWTGNAWLRVCRLCGRPKWSDR